MPNKRVKKPRCPMCFKTCPRSDSKSCSRKCGRSLAAISAGWNKVKASLLRGVFPREVPSHHSSCLQWFANGEHIYFGMPESVKYVDENGVMPYVRVNKSCRLEKGRIWSFDEIAEMGGHSPSQEHFDIIDVL